MVTTSASCYPPFELTAFRKATEGLSGQVFLVCEDSGYRQSVVDELQVCWYAAIHDLNTSRVFLPEDAVADFRQEHPGALIVKLETPVLLLSYSPPGD